LLSLWLRYLRLPHLYLLLLLRLLHFLRPLLLSHLPRLLYLPPELLPLPEQ
jgi:hypothetical protein